MPERKRMRFFRGQDARPLDEAHMTIDGVDGNVAAGMASLTAVSGLTPEAGATGQILFEDEAGFSLALVWFKSGFVLPRHSHNTECLYYILAGELRLGSQILRKGDGFFLPADHAYSYEAGPEGVEVLEFRNATHFHFLFCGNEESHWARIAQAMATHGPAWAAEKRPSTSI
jgi:quercetin dioxygenase-like cupin family protein